MADETAARLYHWEETFVEPRQSPMDRLLTTEQCREYVARACAATGTRLPALRFRKVDRVPCRADLRAWEITLAEWGHSALTVLHEVAHLATYRSVVAGENGHGPSFARMAVEFYAVFLGIDRSYLEATAARCGVSVSPVPPSPRSSTPALSQTSISSAGVPAGDAMQEENRKTAVIGSRTFRDERLLTRTLDAAAPSLVISGGAKGADSLATRWARKRGVEALVFYPDHKKYRHPFHHRNRLIVEACDMLIAFWDGRSTGTKYTIDYAKRMGKPVTVIRF